MKKERGLGEAELANVAESFSVLSEALILVAVWFGSSQRLKHPFGIDVCERASRLLDGVICPFLTEDVAKTPLVGRRGAVELLVHGAGPRCTRVHGVDDAAADCCARRDCKALRGRGRLEEG